MDINNPKKQQSGLGIAGMILGITGVLLSCILVGGALGAIGIVLSIVGLTQKDKSSGTAIAGTVLNSVAIVIAAILFIASLSGYTPKEKNTETQSNNITEADNASAEPSEDNSEQSTPSEDNSEQSVSSESKEEFIASCGEIPYKTLARNPEEYIGQRIVLTVEVAQILKGGLFDNNEYYRVNTRNERGSWIGDEYFIYDFRIDDDTKILKDDILRIYGEFAGMQTVTRAFSGTDEDVPAVKAIYVEILADDEDSFIDGDTIGENEYENLTTGQKNALKKAQQYLSIMPFSYSGLINQLEFEEFPHDDAVFAVDNCGADWNEQAAKKAKSYLDITAFSRDALIQQLEYEGFTHEQAVYGVEQNGY